MERARVAHDLLVMFAICGAGAVTFVTAVRLLFRRGKPVTEL